MQLRYEIYACVVTTLLYLSFYATVGITGPRFAVVFIVPLVIFTALAFITSLNLINENIDTFLKLHDSKN